MYGIGVSNKEVARCARILGYNTESLHFKYLGVPVEANMSLKKELLVCHQESAK